MQWILCIHIITRLCAREECSRAPFRHMSHHALAVVWRQLRRGGSGTCVCYQTHAASASAGSPTLRHACASKKVGRPVTCVSTTCCELMLKRAWSAWPAQAVPPVAESYLEYSSTTKQQGAGCREAFRCDNNTMFFQDIRSYGNGKVPSERSGHRRCRDTRTHRVTGGTSGCVGALVFLHSLL